ncbi:MAG: hypothetical protein ACE367_16920 [Acidimicrobiales bacterium]
MSGAAAGSGWWNEDSTGDDGDAPEGEPAEPPLDNRTTQPMARIDHAEAETEGSPPPSPWSSRSADTIRVESPAWLLRAQKLAAEQNRAAEPSTDDTDEEEPARSGDDVAVAPGAGEAPAAPATADVPAVDAIDPNAVVHEAGAASPAPTGQGRAPTPEGPTSRPKFLDPTIAESYREPRPSPDLAAGTIGLLGAAMLSIGSLLTWARSTGVVEATVTGLTGSNGWGTLACGVVVGFGAVLVLTGRRGGLVGGSMLIAALAAVYLCGFSAVDILRTGDELPDILGGAGVDRDAAEVATLELAAGFAVVAVGAAVALAAGTIAFARRV